MFSIPEFLNPFGWSEEIISAVITGAFGLILFIIKVIYNKYSKERPLPTERDEANILLNDIREKILNLKKLKIDQKFFSISLYEDIISLIVSITEAFMYFLITSVLSIFMIISIHNKPDVVEPYFSIVVALSLILPVLVFMLMAFYNERKLIKSRIEIYSSLSYERSVNELLSKADKILKASHFNTKEVDDIIKNLTSLSEIHVSPQTNVATKDVADADQSTS